MQGAERLLSTEFASLKPNKKLKTKAAKQVIKAPNGKL